MPWSQLEYYFLELFCSITKDLPEFIKPLILRADQDTWLLSAFAELYSASSTVWLYENLMYWIYTRLLLEKIICTVKTHPHTGIEKGWKCPILPLHYKQHHKTGRNINLLCMCCLKKHVCFFRIHTHTSKIITLLTKFVQL